MKKLFLILVSAALATGAYAQNKLVGEVKNEIGSMSANVGTLRTALAKIKPALTNEETAKSATAWFIAGKAGFGMYDKCMGEKAVGKQVDDKEMCAALLEGYGYFMTALELDKVPELQKDGTPKLDKQGNPKFKTKHTKEILSQIAGHANDFMNAGNGFYDAKDFLNAAKAWGIYCDLSESDFLGKNKPEVADSTIAQMRFYQGVAAWQGEDLKNADAAFAKARAKGKLDKEIYDYSMSVAAGIENNEAAVVALAKEAYPLHGKSDNTYARIIINDCLNKEKYDEANGFMDQVIAENPGNAEYLDLKGILLEQQGKEDEAIEYFIKSIEADSEFAKANFDLGRMYFNKAVKVQDANPTLNGKELAELTDPFYKQALPYLEKSFQLDPDNKDVKRALSNIYYQLGDEEKLKAIEQQ